MIRVAGLALLAVVPALGLVVYFYLRDRYEPEPRRYVAAAFLYGMLVLIPALFLGRWVTGWVDPEWRALSGVWGRLYDDFLVAAAVEEGLKWVIFGATIARWREFDEPMDGCVYGATMALGLAVVENLYYVLGRGSLEDFVALVLTGQAGIQNAIRTNDIFEREHRVPAPLGLAATEQADDHRDPFRVSLGCPLQTGCVLVHSSLVRKYRT